MLDAVVRVRVEFPCTCEHRDTVRLEIACLGIETIGLVCWHLFRAAEISGAPAAGYSSDQALDALEEVAAEVLPPEISYAWANMSFQERASSGSAAKVFILAMIFVFLILAALYESWALPFSVLLGTPFAILGSFVAIYVARQNLPRPSREIFTRLVTA